MSDFNRKEHWENIYQTKSLDSVSWYQPRPETSLELIESCQPATGSTIIDIGGGDSFLTDFLLEKGYSNLSVLDISSAAIDRAKKRLGNKASKVNWIVSDCIAFQPETKINIWHDRAAFHFLTNENEINQYVKNAANGIVSNGHLIIGTFSEDGPTKCSGIEIRQYTHEKLQEVFGEFFELEDYFYQDHETPFDTKQNFVFCKFRKK